jgi:uncharacterized protein (DUF952 family)
MTEPETIKAFCYLEQVNDEDNKISLSETHLIVTHRRKTYKFDLPQIKNLDFGHRKAMLFLISGGITVPFTALAFYRDFLDPWPTLLLLFGGVFATYIGWRGYQVLTVSLFGINRDYKLNHLSENLKAFVAFTLKHLPVNHSLSSDAERMIYHITDINTWKNKKSDKHFRGDQRDGFIHASNYDQLAGTRAKYFKGRSQLLLLTIDPLKVHAEIRYEALLGSGKLFPHIYGDLNLDAVVKVEQLS